ncbi:hypothetical protein [Thermocoleostomius sinensis]|uniref:Uncharacterized protein n=1 Tax=Thermocoleostomius sinensis A174 TaxID=2016057 RepID=A0A9E8ZA59_9CYAN|nr:hypothetical protein [Thermocoleostomius sinensis]WAL59136.1 hypothetical protein OXH18_18440 [Thermocoleostomius sinensis A174]
MSHFKEFAASVSPLALSMSLLVPNIGSGRHAIAQTPLGQVQSPSLETVQLDFNETVTPTSPSSDPAPLDSLPSSPDTGVTLPSPLAPVPPQNTQEPIDPSVESTPINPVIIDGVIPDPSAAPIAPSEFNQPVPNESVPNLSVPTSESIN